MASTIDQIDSYLKKNKKTLFNKLNEWYGRNKPIYDGKEFQQAFDDAKNLKYLWNQAQEAQGINSKIEAFNKLTTELDKWTDLEKLEDWEKQLEEQGLENWKVPEDKIEMDKMRLFGQLSNRPEINKFEDLNINDIWSQGYDYDQMKQLAADYGYNYQDKDERKEFLDKLEEYHKQKNVEKAFALDKDAPFLDKLKTGVVDLMLPVSKEYARQNYQNIDGEHYIDDLAAPLAADLGINAAMFGTGGAVAGTPFKNVATKQFVKNVVNNMSAPVIKGVSNAVLNKEEGADVAKDIVGEVSTNIATPFLLKGGYRWATRPFQGGAQGQAAKDYINQKANAARDVQKKLRNGGVWQEFEMIGPDKIGNVRYKTIRKEKGRYVIKEISPEEYARNNNKITLKELDAFGEDSKLLRDKKTNAEEAVAAEYAPSIEPAGEYLTEKKMRTASLQGQDPMSTLTSDELEVMGAKPKESIWNWAKSKFGEAPGIYITNAQGRGQYGNRFLGGLSTLIPNDIVNEETFKKEPKLSEKDLAEIELFRKLSELSKKSNFSKYVKKPKLPEKFKKFKNDPTIVEIFGIQEED